MVVERYGGVYAEAHRVRAGDTPGARRCYVGAGPRAPFSGTADCRGGSAALSTRRLDDGSQVVRYLLQGVQPRRPWALQLQVTTASARVVINSHERTRRTGLLFSRVTLSPAPDQPRFKIVASSGRGRACRLWLNPGQPTGG